MGTLFSSHAASDFAGFAVFPVHAGPILRVVLYLRSGQFTQEKETERARTSIGEVGSSKRSGAPNHDQESCPKGIPGRM
jgi:hypothetical protein